MKIFNRNLILYLIEIIQNQLSHAISKILNKLLLVVKIQPCGREVSYSWCMKNLLDINILKI